jgi:hypothetical protein
MDYNCEPRCFMWQCSSCYSTRVCDHIDDIKRRSRWGHDEVDGAQQEIICHHQLMAWWLDYETSGAQIDSLMVIQYCSRRKKSLASLT